MTTLDWAKIIIHLVEKIKPFLKYFPMQTLEEYIKSIDGSDRRYIDPKIVIPRDMDFLRSVNFLVLSEKTELKDSPEQPVHYRGERDRLEEEWNILLSDCGLLYIWHAVYLKLERATGRGNEKTYVLRAKSCEITLNTEGVIGISSFLDINDIRYNLFTRFDRLVMSARMNLRKLDSNLGGICKEMSRINNLIRKH